MNYKTLYDTDINKYKGLPTTEDDLKRFKFKDLKVEYRVCIKNLKIRKNRIFNLYNKALCSYIYI